MKNSSVKTCIIASNFIVDFVYSLLITMNGLPSMLRRYTVSPLKFMNKPLSTSPWPLHNYFPNSNKKSRLSRKSWENVAVLILSSTHKRITSSTWKRNTMDRSQLTLHISFRRWRIKKYPKKSTSRIINLSSTKISHNSQFCKNFSFKRFISVVFAIFLLMSQKSILIISSNNTKFSMRKMDAIIPLTPTASIN